MDNNQIVVMGLVALVVGALLFLAMPYLTGSYRAEQRQKMLLNGEGRSKGGAFERDKELAQRRKQIADSLKDLDAKASSKKITLEMRLAQAGLDWSKSKFYTVSAGLAVAMFLVALAVTKNPLYALAGIPVGGIGLPNWIIRFVKNRRLKKFNHEFPNAIDVIIRGIKAGLPLGDCLRIIASEANEPVRSEFRRIVEAQSMGLTIGQAVERLPESIPCSESNFFSIVINIQQKAGGNLSEALGNLSGVLRDRKKMQTKIKAMSAEAKASAGIIGALPFIVGGMVYLTSPRYIELLWITPTGRLVMAVAGFWMFLGVMSMKKMVSFDI